MGDLFDTLLGPGADALEGGPPGPAAGPPRANSVVSVDLEAPEPAQARATLGAPARWSRAGSDAPVCRSRTGSDTPGPFAAEPPPSVGHLLAVALELERTGAREARFWTSAGWVLGGGQLLIWLGGALLLLKLILVDWPEPSVRTELFVCIALFCAAMAFMCLEKTAGGASKGAAGQMASRLAHATYQTLNEVHEGPISVAPAAVADYAQRSFRQIQLVLSPEPEILIVRG